MEKAQSTLTSTLNGDCDAWKKRKKEVEDSEQQQQQQQQQIVENNSLKAILEDIEKL